MLTTADLQGLVRASIQLSAEKDRNRLLAKLLECAMDTARCDAGTLYLYKDEGLVFRVMKTLSQGVSSGEHGEPINLPPVALREENVCAFSAIHRELVNIPDVYNSERFDFSGPKRYDAMTGYRTGSMLVIPLEESEGELIGVLQLINKLDEDGTTIPFTEDDEYVIQSLGSMTAVALANMIYTDEIKAQMHSFVQAFATAVDERTPYNGTHTRKVTIYADLLALHINKLHDEGLVQDCFDEVRREQLVLSAALHDIGKMIVPLSVMNKATRLDGRLELVQQRFQLFEALYDCDLYSGRITQQRHDELVDFLNCSLALILEKDSAGFLPDDVLEQLAQIAAHTYEYPDGRILRLLTEEEAACLQVRKGTLTADERLIMESHAAMTRKILSKVRFNRRYNQVITFASQHHEFLNGTGYPDKLTADQLSLETRILTVVDVFDALTCTDRPYKVPIPRPKAFAILHSMAKDGQIEDQLVCWLEEALEDISGEDIERMAQADTWGTETLT